MKDVSGKVFLVLFLMLILFTILSFRVFSNERLNIAVSIMPGKTFVEEVGGEFVEVTVMIPPGYSPATYAPGPARIADFFEADIYFSFGVPADEAKILPLINRLNSNIRVIRFDKEVAAYFPEREFAPGKRDPHIWLSPERVKVMIDVIARELADLDPVHKQTYFKRARDFNNKLTELDNQLKRMFSGQAGKTFIVYHPAFGYLADDYGLKMVSIEQSGKKATARTLQKIIEIAREKGIKTIFYQAEIDSKQPEVIAEEIGGKAVCLDPLASNYIENLLKIAGLLRENLR